jgi:hypothetical protein
MVKRLVILLPVIMGCLRLCADIPKTHQIREGGYQKIPERNLFNLREPTLVETNAQKEIPALPKVTLNGITTILGRKLALLTLPAKPAKAGEAAHDEYLTLAVGERQGEIEVLAIDEKKGSVNIKNSGTPTLLTFEKDGVKTKPSGTIPNPPGAPSQNPAPPSTTPGLQPTNVAPQPGGNWPRPKFMPMRGGIGSATSNLNTGELSNIPSPTGSTSGVPIRAQGSQLTPEQEAILRELEKERINQPGQQPNNTTAPQ